MAAKNQRGNLVMALRICALILAAAYAHARLLDIKLADLVKKSELIAYGETTTTVSTPSRVSFRPREILKGKPPSGEIVLCNEPHNVESYDLRTMKVPYVVFAANEGDCYRPVHGASSIIEVDDGIARTVSIIDQPDGQPLQTFLEKIQPCPATP